MHNYLRDEGCKAVAAVLPQTQIKELKCAPPAQALAVQRPLTLSTFPAPRPVLCGSLAGNKLTNGGKDMAAVLKLAEALPLSKLKSLECAAPHVLAICVSAP